MKSIKQIILVVSILFLFSSCKTSSLSISVLEPAQINVPPHIKKIAVINHSLPDKEQLAWNFIEGFITGESIFADRDGSINCINGLVNKLNNGPRFEAQSLANIEIKGGTGTRQLPTPLSWETVEHLCKEHNVDGLIVLETFDSNTGVKEGTRNVKKVINNVERIVPEFLSDLTINVNATWRIYDFVNKQIIDESTFADQKTWNSTGTSPHEARNRMPMKRNAINDAGYFAGQRYGVRISPNWRWVSRYYFIKGSDDFKQAARYVKTNDWKEAAGIWKKYTNDADSKIAGRACHNMAVACEVEGKLEAAIEWAGKAYHTYNIKNDGTYLNTLKHRQNDASRLSDQMGN